MGERTTIDGIPVKFGDLVWFVRLGLPIRWRALRKLDLGAWWETMTSKEIYSTEHAAVAAAIVMERRALSRARQQVRRAKGAIERLAKRKAALDAG